MNHENFISKTKKSRQLYNRAKKVLPSGVSYFIRYFEPYPFFVNWAKGSKIKDVDGNIFIDYWMGHYTHILGHSPNEIIKAVADQINHGTHYGVSHELEIALAELIVKMVPSAQMVRFCNSGTEAAMYSIRLARSFTDEPKIIKFEGGWHGGYDSLHLAVKSPFGVPESAGLYKEKKNDTIVAPFNDLSSTEKILLKQEVAAIIVEPVLGAGGCIPADLEFLKGLRELCDDTGTLLIFDEIITGFRLAPGGGQQYYGVIPDLTILGKVLGGGFPIGGITGKQEIMERMDPLLYERPKFSFHGGTFTGNPISLTAGLKMLKMLEDGQIINKLNKKGERMQADLADIFDRYGISVQVNRAGSLFKVHFIDEEVINTRIANEADQEKLHKYHLTLINNGVFFLPGKSGAISNAHTEDDLQRVVIETRSFVESIS